MSLVSNDELRPDVAGPSAPATTGGETWGPASGPRDRRRRWPAFVVIGSVLAIGAAGAVYVLSQDDSATEPTEVSPIRVVEATQRDLIEFEELSASMVYGDLRSITVEQAATVTASVESGAVLVRGDTVVELDGTPVVLFYGDVPLYRPLTVGSEGDDVLLLEANLASLGYHTELDEDDNEIATDFAVDGVFDESTQDAVIRWQDDLGVATTGEVLPTDVVVAPGSVEVIDASATLGDRVMAGSTVVEYTTAGTADAFYGEHDGEIDLEVASGDAVTSGQVLYTVDGRPVIAVVADADDVDFERDLALGIDDGDDIEVIETMLVELGYDAGGDLEVDDEFTEETAEAITDFWDDLADRYDDLDVVDELALDDIVVVAPDTVVGMPTEHDAEILAAGTQLWSSESGEAQRIVTTELPVADQADLQLGQTVDIEFPDGSIVAGTVSDVARTSVLDPTMPDADPMLPIEISIDEIPESAAAFNELDVTVLITDEVAQNAIVVPVTALVAIGDGNYAVEVVAADGTTRFVAVDVGMFADGNVEVTGIDAGQSVVVP